MFSDNTLYYFFSTLAQVLAAIIALVAVLVHFRMSVLRDFLIGDGESIKARKDFKESGYEILNDFHYRRLIDAIYRKDINGVESVIRQLADYEKKAGVSIKERPKGFQGVLRRFLITKNQINEMSTISKNAFMYSIVTAFFSSISILFVDIVVKYNSLQILLIIINLILLTFCLIYLVKGISLGLKSITNRI